MKVGLPRSADRSSSKQTTGRRETLLDFFDDVYTSSEPFLVFDDGYRAWNYTYVEVKGAAYTFAARLRSERIAKGDKIILWGENRPEWLVALWGAISEGVIVVPVDYRSSADLVHRIQGVVKARAILIGHEVAPLDATADVPVWRLADIDWSTSEPPRNRVQIEAGDTAEIIFTSGATAEPKGVVITHRNVLANIIPIEREVAKYVRSAYYLAALFFNAFPIPRREAGARETLRYIGDLVGDGYSILIFPEGQISHRGDVLPFQPGVGMLASRLNVPVVPVRLEGIDRILHPTWRMARPGRANVTFGSPLRLQGQDYASLAKQVEEAVKALAQ